MDRIDATGSLAGRLVGPLVGGLPPSLISKRDGVRVCAANLGRVTTGQLERNIQRIAQSSGVDERTRRPDRQSRAYCPVLSTTLKRAAPLIIRS
jgi:hypothetical protein